MRAAQLYNAAKVLNGYDVPDNKGVNFTEWRNVPYITISFMDSNGVVQSYDIYEDGGVVERVRD